MENPSGPPKVPAEANRETIVCINTQVSQTEPSSLATYTKRIKMNSDEIAPVATLSSSSLPPSEMKAEATSSGLTHEGQLIVSLSPFSCDIQGRKLISPM